MDAHSLRMLLSSCFLCCDYDLLSSNEARQISVAIYNLLVIAGLALALHFFVLFEQPAADYALTNGAILLVALSISSLLIIPKILVVRSDSNTAADPRHRHAAPDGVAEPVCQDGTEMATPAGGGANMNAANGGGSQPPSRHCYRGKIGGSREANAIRGAAGDPNAVRNSKQ